MCRVVCGPLQEGTTAPSTTAWYPSPFEPLTRLACHAAVGVTGGDLIVQAVWVLVVVAFVFVVIVAVFVAVLMLGSVLFAVNQHIQRTAYPW